MSITCGKKARKRMGNRYDIMRSAKRTKHTKIFTNNKLTPSQYSAMKQADRKRLRA